MVGLWSRLRQIKNILHSQSLQRYKTLIFYPEFIMSKWPKIIQVPIIWPKTTLKKPTCTRRRALVPMVVTRVAMASSMAGSARDLGGPSWRRV